MSNRNILILIACLLVVILAILGAFSSQSYHDGARSNDLAESAREFKEEVQDEIDDNTTDR